MTIDKILGMEEEMRQLWFEGTSFTSKSSMCKLWENIRRSENILEYATKVNEDGSDFLTPTLASLILLDYENVDPLAYDIITNIIYQEAFYGKLSRTDQSIYNTVPYFLKDYGLTYLTATLFNDNLYLSQERKNFLINVGYLCYEPIDSSFQEFDEEEKNYQGIYPIDIRYFILTHPAFMDMREELIHRDFYKYSYEDYIKLMNDYKTRANLRKLKRLPF